MAKVRSRRTKQDLLEEVAVLEKRVAELELELSRSERAIGDAHAMIEITTVERDALLEAMKTVSKATQAMLDDREKKQEDYDATGE